MPQLFSLPKAVPLSSVGGLLPGAKLHFFQTGTSTPQNTYTDIALSVAHENPVEADAEGVFPPIYLDPTRPHYRVRLTTSADVQLWQVDNFPSNQNTAQTFTLSSSAPSLIFNETDASANNAKWRIRASGEQLLIELLNDAESVATPIATFSRNGVSSPVVDFDTAFLENEGYTVVSMDFDSFTATLTGMSASTTGEAIVTKLRAVNLCTITVASAITGTSNTTAMTLTGVPSDYRPVGNTTGFALMIDNGTTKGGLATISSSGVITFGIGIDGSTAFTNSGTKGIPARWYFIYPI